MKRFFVLLSLLLLVIGSAGALSAGSFCFAAEVSDKPVPVSLTETIVDIVKNSQEFTKEKIEQFIKQKEIEAQEAQTPSAIEILGEDEYYILAKLLYCEAGGMTLEGQIYTCSATLNLRDYRETTIWDLAHDVNTMAVAPWVDYAEPNETQYEVIEAVVSGDSRVPDICYWQCGWYHSFGTPVIEVDGHYFSMP